MAKTLKSWSALKSALQKEMYDALDEATEKSLDDLQENVNYFYTAPEGQYKRTGQLKSSPQIDAINHNGDTAISQISINTSTQYYPAGRDTETIYGYAEDDGLLGYGGFWRETLIEIEENVKKSFSKRFRYK